MAKLAPAPIAATPPSGEVESLVGLLKVLQDPAATEAKLAEIREELAQLATDRREVAAAKAALEKLKAEVDAQAKANEVRGDGLDRINAATAKREDVVQLAAEKAAARDAAAKDAEVAIARRELAAQAREKAITEMEADIAGNNEHSRELLREAMDLADALAKLRDDVVTCASRIGKRI